MGDRLTETERSILLLSARESIENTFCGKERNCEETIQSSIRLKEPGASFVTLTKNGELRGCVGGLEPIMSLIDDVKTHAVTAAFHDYRFSPVQIDELQDIRIEISYLTEPERIEYDNPSELINYIRPNIDGVIIREGARRATFLPQVWNKLPEAEEFLSHLCMKMGVGSDYWRENKLEVFRYQVEEFHEKTG